MNDHGLTPREQERLTVMRVIALAEPTTEKVWVWRADLVALLAAVDRLAQPREPAAQAHQAVSGVLAGAYVASPQITIWAGTTVILRGGGGAGE